MDDNDNDILNETRQAAIKSAANLLQAADHAKRLRKKFFASRSVDDDRPGGSDRGDFLFDVLRLNAEFLNRLAGIGARHSHLPQRALERLYSMVVPRSEREAAQELSFTPERRVDAIVLYNDVAPGLDETTITWSALRPPLPGALQPVPWLLSINGVSPPDDRDTVEHVPWPYRQTVTIKVSLRKQFLSDRKHTAEIVVHEGKSRRHIPVVIDFRPDLRRGQP